MRSYFIAVVMIFLPEAYMFLWAFSTIGLNPISVNNLASPTQTTFTISKC